MKKQKILVIEDTEEVRENICEIIELAGYEACSAKNGKIGVEMAIREQPDLIICDVMMPELDGFGVLKILSQNSTTFNIPFIFLTAKAESSDFRKGMGLGAEDYITKPFDDTDFLESIEIRLAKNKRMKEKYSSSRDNLKSFFSEIKANQEFDKLTENREIRKYSKKENIYEEGGVLRWLFYIDSGSVKIYRNNELGKELITHVYNRGDFFGFVPLITESKYQDNAIALDNTTLKLVPKDDFKTLLFNNREFAAQFVKMLASSVSQTEQELIDLAYSSVRKKVANALITFAIEDGDNNILVVLVSREDLATKAGTAKETLIRTLSDFKAEGILDIDKNSIFILNYEKLRSMPQ